MGQISFSDAEYAGKRKKTRREVDGATTVDGDGRSPSAKRMRHAKRGESRSQRLRENAIARPLALCRLNALASSRCSDLP
jgi:hypothetical protein